MWLNESYRSIAVISILFLHLLITTYGKHLETCRFFSQFYHRYPNIFRLHPQENLLTVGALYSLTNQSFSSINQSLSMGIISRFADTYLVPVPLLFSCTENEEIYAPNDCQMTMRDTRADSSIRISEATRTSTVPLRYHSQILRGAYFRQSSVTLKHCRILINGTSIELNETFQLRIEFEQTIGSQCEDQCSHPRLYQCLSTSKTCQCRSYETGIERFHQYCVDTELGSNCSHSPERCRRQCPLQETLSIEHIEQFCQCPLGSRRIERDGMIRCEMPISTIECDDNHPCSSQPIRLDDNFLPIPVILFALLIGALFIIIVLIIGLLKMRAVKCVKFVHPSTLSTHSGNSSPATITRLSTVISSASPCSTLSSSSKSVQLPSKSKLSEKYQKIDLFD